MIQNIETFEILGVRISRVNLTSACARIDEFISDKSRCRYVCVAPVSTIISCQENESYRRIINQADMVTPDGMPVVWLGRWKGYKEVARAYGPDLMAAVCRQGVNRSYRHYFYGGSPETCQRLIENLKKNFPGIAIAGVFSPPFTSEAQEAKPETIAAINSLKPDILWVGLGSPKQDIWMYKHRDKVNVPVIIGVGAAFDFLAGTKKQAPLWMRGAGLEWLFRLCCEPRRLWRRYLIGNSKFVYLLLKERFTSSI